MFVVGAHGRLGQSIIRACKAKIVPRDLYKNVNKESLMSFFRETSRKGEAIVVAAGLTDPNLAKQALLNANFEMPSVLLEVAQELELRILTTGSISEHFAPESNSYSESKRRLSAFVSERAIEGANALHVRFHTMYGMGQPANHMFLGLIVSSIRSQREFAMTSGRQLREYHHYDDIAKIILRLAKGTEVGCADVNSGTPIALRDLAMRLFEQMDCSHLLKIGAIPDPDVDNYNNTFSRSKFVKETDFRETISGVSNYVSSVLERTKR